MANIQQMLKISISIKTPDQLQLFLDQEEQMLHDMVSKVINSGANVVFVEKRIDDIAQHYLAKVDIVEEKKISEEAMTFVTGCHNPKAVSIILRGGTEHVVDEAERALHDALRVVGVAIEDETLVAGGGSPEVELALRLREYSTTLIGREQLAVAKFADVLEVIPRTLAENAGLDLIDILVEMRSQHENGKNTACLNVFTGKVVDMWKEGVVEPLRVKTQAIDSAT
jgi:chaperonin GroEL (HSP60 family)